MRWSPTPYLVGASVLATATAVLDPVHFGRNFSIFVLVAGALAAIPVGRWLWLSWRLTRAVRRAQREHRPITRLDD